MNVKTTPQPFRLRTALLAATAAPLVLAAGQAAAQQNPPPRGNNVLIGEIVVTAQKRVENIQDVPLAVSAYSGEQMRAMNIQDATRIVDLVPNFKAGGLG
ncbi:MAG: hypothetical protein JWQ97_1756, partial [Phenylobacterium sp.]|nr:hypothetical protein [Phenylobacterium sp.]